MNERITRFDAKTLPLPEQRGEKDIEHIELRVEDEPVGNAELVVLNYPTRFRFVRYVDVLDRATQDLDAAYRAVTERLKSQGLTAFAYDDALEGSPEHGAYLRAGWAATSEPDVFVLSSSELTEDTVGEMRTEVDEWVDARLEEVEGDEGEKDEFEN